MLAGLEVVLGSGEGRGKGGFPDRVGQGLQELLNILLDYICLPNAVRD